MNGVRYGIDALRRHAGTPSNPAGADRITTPLNRAPRTALRGVRKRRARFVLHTFEPRDRPERKRKEE